MKKVILSVAAALMVIGAVAYTGNNSSAKSSTAAKCCNCSCTVCSEQCTNNACSCECKK